VLAHSPFAVGNFPLETPPDCRLGTNYQPPHQRKRKSSPPAPLRRLDAPGGQPHEVQRFHHRKPSEPPLQVYDGLQSSDCFLPPFVSTENLLHSCAGVLVGSFPSQLASLAHFTFDNCQHLPVDVSIGSQDHPASVELLDEFGRSF